MYMRGIDISLYPITTPLKKRENSMTTCDFFKSGAKV
jgi:hypothetical protein